MGEVPPLPESTILLCEVGSTAHGTGLPGGEDHDETAVMIETAKQCLGLSEGKRTVMHRSQPEGTRSGPGDTDRTVYPLRKFLRLAAAGNPSILLTLWAPILQANDRGREMRALSEAFIGRHVIPPYRGYMQGQALRLLGLKAIGHGKRGGGQREELIAAHGFDTKYAMHAARLGFQCVELLSTYCLRLPIQGEPGEWLRAVRRGEIAFDDWWNVCLGLDAQMEKLLEADWLPAGADRERIEEWSVAVHREAWGG